MANFSLSWTPQPNGNSTGQEVNSRGKTAGGAYTVKATLSTAASTYAPLSLSDNLVHQVHVANKCSVGGPALSNTVELAYVACVGAVSLSAVDHQGATVSFAALGGDVDSYVVELKQGGTLRATATKATAATVTHTFTGLSASSTYDVFVTGKIGTGWSNTCQKGTLTTTAAPIVCNPPTSVSAAHAPCTAVPAPTFYAFDGTFVQRSFVDTASACDALDRQLYTKPDDYTRQLYTASGGFEAGEYCFLDAAGTQFFPPGYHLCSTNSIHYVDSESRAAGASECPPPSNP